MLSGFQETAQKIQEKDETTLVPFYMFYDTLHTFLDSSIRRVIERCQRAADNSDGIEQYDVSILKLLYLVRYISNDIKSERNARSVGRPNGWSNTRLLGISWVDGKFQDEEKIV